MCAPEQLDFDLTAPAELASPQLLLCRDPFHGYGSPTADQAAHARILQPRSLRYRPNGLRCAGLRHSDARILVYLLLSRYFPYLVQLFLTLSRATQLDSTAAHGTCECCPRVRSSST